jgi:hypothetical protein
MNRAAKQALYGYRLLGKHPDVENSNWVFVNDVSDMLRIGIALVDGTCLQYDNQAYNIHRWAIDRGITIEHCRFDFDSERMMFTRIGG